MIEGRNLIVLSDDWGRHPFSCQHLIKRFLKYNRVLWVNTIGYRRLKISRYDLKRGYEKMIGWLTKSANQQRSVGHDNLFILNPICIPFGKTPLIRNFNTRSVTGLIRKTARRHQFTDTIVITTLPTAADFVGKLDEKHAVYYCVDDFTQWPGVYGSLMLAMEGQLLKKVELVVATSEKLRQTRSNAIRPTQLLEHGVDVEHFRSVAKAVPSDAVIDLKPPVVAFCGLLDERCDLALIRHLANNMRDVTFLFIGQCRVNVGDLSIMPNVCMTGPVPYDDLPKYLAPASALILPYVIDALTVSINPLKLKEYIATGLPVVSTPLPEVVKLERFVRIADGNDAFHQMLSEVLDNPLRHNSEIETFLSENSWDQKAEEFSIMIEDALQTI